MRVWADDPTTPDHQDSWDQFLEQFRAEYADTQKAERARTQIEEMHMKNNNIDQYITDFISTANDAGYHLEGESTKRTFVRGLGKFIAGEVYRRVPNPYTWQQVIPASRSSLRREADACVSIRLTGASQAPMVARGVSRSFRAHHIDAALGLESDGMLRSRARY